MPLTAGLPLSALSFITSAGGRGAAGRELARFAAGRFAAARFGLGRDPGRVFARAFAAAGRRAAFRADVFAAFVPARLPDFFAPRFREAEDPRDFALFLRA